MSPGPSLRRTQILLLGHDGARTGCALSPWRIVRRCLGSNHRVVEEMVGAMSVPRPISGLRREKRSGAEATQLRAFGRHRRRPQHIIAGANRRKLELGLSLLLAAGCLDDGFRALWAWVSRRS